MATANARGDQQNTLEIAAGGDVSSVSRQHDQLSMAHSARTVEETNSISLEVEKEHITLCKHEA
jgi:hypothetical protein